MFQQLFGWLGFCNLKIYLLLLSVLVGNAESASVGNAAGDVQGVIGEWREKLQLKCPAGYSLHIVDSSFGNPLLAGETIYKSARDAPHAKLVLQQHCESLNSCEILVDPLTFGILNSTGLAEPKLAVTFACLEALQRLPAAAADSFEAKPVAQGGWNVMIRSAKERADVAGLRRAYVHLLDIDAECENPLQTKPEVRTLEAAENRCSELEQCSFIIVRPHQVVLCQSLTYKNPKRSAGSLIYVKAFKAFGSASQMFTLHPNVQSICERDQLMGDSGNVRNAEDAADQCLAVGCDFFVMSTVNPIQGAASDFMNHVWLCRGRPVFMPFEGFVLGERRGGANLATVKGHSHNGPIASQ